MTESKTVIAAVKPILVKIVQGKRYFWCACGKSKTQPFCDGSHMGTGIEPRTFVGDKTGDVLLCRCKRTKSPPYCDGSHNDLVGAKDNASSDDIELTYNAVSATRDNGEVGMARLDGGAYVLTPLNTDPSKVRESVTTDILVSTTQGAQHLHVERLDINKPSNFYCYEKCETSLFVSAGRGVIEINGSSISVAAEAGVFIGKGEIFQIIPEAPMRVFKTICPQPSGRASTGVPDKSDMQSTVDLNGRIEMVDADKAEKMADRTYQVLVGDAQGSVELTEFLGRIPRSRAAFHQHLYEEAIVILSGRGTMWTPGRKAAVHPGDIIFLPARQPHSLECDSDDGMRLMGVFYPAGSPAINY